MKIFFTALSITIISLAACKSENKKTTEITKDSTENAVDTLTPVPTPSVVNTAAVMNEMTAHYLHIKNALATDNRKEAAAGGKAFLEALAKMDKAALPAEKAAVWNDAAESAKEMATHISTHADKISHQREHFDMLSSDMYDLVKAFGPGQTLYQVHCPMYNNNKGATWLSETKEIKNPYYGKEMLTCGNVKEEITQ